MCFFQEEWKNWSGSSSIHKKMHISWWVKCVSVWRVHKFSGWNFFSPIRAPIGRNATYLKFCVFLFASFCCRWMKWWKRKTDAQKRTSVRAHINHIYIRWQSECVKIFMECLRLFSGYILVWLISVLWLLFRVNVCSSALLLLFFGVSTGGAFIGIKWKYAAKIN